MPASRVTALFLLRPASFGMSQSEGCILNLEASYWVRANDAYDYSCSAQWKADHHGGA